MKICEVIGVRIALFLEVYFPYVNGVITYTSMLKDSFERMGHQVLIVTADPDLLRHRLREGVLYCPALRMKKLYGYGLASPFSHSRMKYLKEFDPDIIHIHNEFGISLFGVYAARRLNKPLVYTFHTMYDDYIFYVANRVFQPIAKGIFHRYLKFISNRADEITSPSQKAVDFFKQCGVDKEVSIVPNGVDLNAFTPTTGERSELAAALREKLGIPQDALTGIFVGRVGKEKAIDWLLQAWADNIKGIPSHSLIILGDGPSLEEMKALAVSLGLEKQVIFTGKVDHRQVPLYYAASDYYTTASLSEMMSISAMEALASGLPAVVRMDPTNKNQIQEGVNGYTYTTPKEMADIIFKLREIPADQWAALRHQVRESMHQATADDSAQFIIRIYEKATQEAPRNGLKASP